jgi:sn-glycerol 3-phosphate transport system permease protein
MPNRQKIILYILLIIFATLFFSPVVIALMMSFMENQDILTGQIVPAYITFDNYIMVLDRFPFLHFLMNSFIVSVMIMTAQLIVSSLAAYAFVFLKFKGRDVLFILFIATMMVPWEATIIPNFHTVRDLNWINTYWGLTVPFFAIAFGTFLLRQNFKQIPMELKEASEVAGVGSFRFYLTIVLPMARASLVTLGAWGFLTSWNMFLWPLLTTTTNEVRTVQIGLRQLRGAEQLNEWGIIMAGTIMVIVPTLMLLFLGQKRLQKGLTEGAIK